MKTKKNHSQKRREFLKEGLRNIFLGVLLVIGGSLGWRNFGKSKKNVYVLQPPQVTSPCYHCCQISQCNNPLAVAFKKNDNTTNIDECPEFKRGNDGGEKK